MTSRTRVRAILATAVAAAAVVAGGVTVPAHAETASYADPADATASLTDIRSVVVRHATGRLRVTVGFTDLRRRSSGGPSGLLVTLDTRPGVRGAEYRLATGLQAGTDYQLVRVRAGRVVGSPLTCDHKVRLRFADDVMVFSVDRACIRTPERVRVAVKMRDEWDASHPVVDWLGEPRSYTDWVVSS